MGCEHRRRARAGRGRGSRKKLTDALRWQKQWGASLKIWQKTYDRGGEPPRQFFEQPEIAEHLHVHWTAFLDLSSERQLGMGIGPIPRSKLHQYVSEEIGLDGDAHEHFCRILRRVDDDYVSMSNETKKPDKPGMRDEVPIDDSAGVRSLLKRVAKKRPEGSKEKH